MKMLRFIYALLALAIAFMGSLLASLSYMIGFSFLFFIGLSIMLLGVCVGIICLISWIGLIIAYKPELALVTNEKIKSRLTLLTVLIVLDVVSFMVYEPSTNRLVALNIH